MCVGELLNQLRFLDYFIPLLLLLLFFFFSVIIQTEIYCYIRQVRRTSKNKRERKKTTIECLFLIAMFLFCHFFISYTCEFVRYV